MTRQNLDYASKSRRRRRRPSELILQSAWRRASCEKGVHSHRKRTFFSGQKAATRPAVYNPIAQDMSTRPTTLPPLQQASSPPYHGRLKKKKKKRKGKYDDNEDAMTLPAPHERQAPTCSRRSENSNRNERRFSSFQKKGCLQTSPADGRRSGSLAVIRDTRSYASGTWASSARWLEVTGMVRPWLRSTRA